MFYLSAFADEAGSSIDEQIKALKKNSINYIDIRTVDGINIMDLSFEQCHNYYNKLKAADIGVNCLGSPAGKVDIDIDFNEYFKKFKELLTKAEIFCTNKIRIFSFYNTANNFDKVTNRLQAMVDAAAETGVSLYLENERLTCGENLQNIKELLKSVKGLKNLLDPANYVLLGENIDNVLAELGGVTEFYHIKDAIYGRSAVPAGYGQCKIKEMLEAAEGEIYLTLEPHLKAFSGFSTFDKGELKSDLGYRDLDESFGAAVNAVKNIIRLTGKEVR